MSNASDRDHVTLFRGAADNPYFELYFNALPAPGAENVDMEAIEVDLRPERDVTLHVEVFNPEGTIPLVVTPGGMGECDGFRGFARNVAAAERDFKVIIWDRRNLGRSTVAFGSEPLMIEEAEDLRVLLDRLDIERSVFYGMSSGSRSNLVLAQRYPKYVAGLVIAPLTGGHTAATRLPEEYYLKYLDDDSLTSMAAVADTPLWSAYMSRNTTELREALLAQDVDDFLGAMRRTGEHLASYRHQTTLGMTDDEVAALDVPATLILHHGVESDELHPIPNSRAATTLFNDCTFHIADDLDSVLELMVPFVRAHSPTTG